MINREQLLNDALGSLALSKDETKQRCGALTDAVVALVKQDGNSIVGITSMIGALGILLAETVFASTFPDPYKGIKMAEEGGKLLGDKIVIRALLEMQKLEPEEEKTGAFEKTMQTGVI